MPKRRAWPTLCALMAVLPCGAAIAQNSCTVTDPTGTPLNIRSDVNGPIIGRAGNGARVVVVEVARDVRGRPWALIRPAGSEFPVGWVFREFISCY
jgi:hypothetical protein